MSSLEPTLSKILNLGKLRHPASRTRRTPETKIFSLFPIWRAEESFNMDVKILFLVFCPQGLGQMAELEFGLGQSKTVICGVWIWSGLDGLGFCLETEKKENSN